MAIVFVSPQKKQKIFITAASALLAVFLVAAFVVFLVPELRNKPIEISEEEAYKTPDIKINFDIIDSEKVKDLESFSRIHEPAGETGIGRKEPFTPYYTK